MFRFAIKTLLSDRGKALTALIGVVFSLVLVNIQGGLFLGFIQKASLLVDNCAADIWVCHRGTENADLAYDIPEVWAERIRGLSGVELAEPYVVFNAMMSLANGEFEGVWVIGSDPASMLGTGWRFREGNVDDLYRPDAISVDVEDSWKLGHPEIGTIMEINGHRAKVVAKTQGILGFLTTPYVFTTIDNARRFTRIQDGYCSYILVKTRGGSTTHDIEATADAIRRRVPYADVLTARTFSNMSREYWMNRTGIGLSFGFATLLGVVVGLVMVGQSLYALALDHLPDYATLKAIGAEDSHVYSVVILQSLLIAFVGVAIGMVLVLFVERYIMDLERLMQMPLTPIIIPRWLLASGIGIVVGICLLACVLPFRRIRHVDPIMVLQG